MPRKSHASPSGPPASRRLKSLRNTDSFRDFVIDQLVKVPDLRARAMFGGLGLYATDVFFGILAADVLYFKVDETTRPDYDSAGSSPFKPYAGRAMTMGYYEVPVTVLEDQTMLATWAKQAIQVAKASRTPVPARPRRRSRSRSR